jgi:hypothetical protein
MTLPLRINGCQERRRLLEMRVNRATGSKPGMIWPTWWYQMTVAISCRGDPTGDPALSRAGARRHDLALSLSLPGHRQWTERHPRGIRWGAYGWRADLDPFDAVSALEIVIHLRSIHHQQPAAIRCQSGLHALGPEAGKGSRCSTTIVVTVCSRRAPGTCTASRSEQTPPRARPAQPSRRSLRPTRSVAPPIEITRLVGR